jgi:hypothetical protein
MADSADRATVSTSIGEVSVQFGWNGWVAVEAAGQATKRAVVRRRDGLSRLLVEFGVAESEAPAAAKAIWATRPLGAWRPEPDAWESPWKQHKYGTLAVFLIGLVAAFVYIVVLKLDWVGV